LIFNLMVFPLVLLLPPRPAPQTFAPTSIFIFVMKHTTYDLIRRDMKRLGQKISLKDYWMGDMGGGVNVDPKNVQALRTDLLSKFWIELRMSEGCLDVESTLPHCDIKVDFPTSSQEALRQCESDSPIPALYSLLLKRHVLTKQDLPAQIHYTIRPWLTEYGSVHSKQKYKLANLFEGTFETRRQSKLIAINFQFTLERLKGSSIPKLIPAYPKSNGYFVFFRSP